mmetsp:Transcript_110626/g.277123  ORF Transcript_110626/g.277123 Transcript_110626/m.277123 type:complete len:291 (-) Transcript_110626:711-1583(-)
MMRTALVLHWASRAWCLDVLGWKPRPIPRPLHFRRIRIPKSAIPNSALLGEEEETLVRGARCNTASPRRSARRRAVSSPKSTKATMCSNCRRMRPPCCRLEAAPSASVVRCKRSGTSTRSSRSSSLMTAMAWRVSIAAHKPSVGVLVPPAPGVRMEPAAVRPSDRKRRAATALSSLNRAANSLATAFPSASSSTISQRCNKCATPLSCSRHASTARPAALRTEADRSARPATRRDKAAGPKAETAVGCWASVWKSSARTEDSTSSMRLVNAGAVMPFTRMLRTVATRTVV